jgi:lipopolysaccharide transport system permease protein
VAFVVVVVAIFLYGIVPPVQILLMPLLLVLALVTAIGIGLWLSALNVRYRDVHHAIPFVILLGLFISPITYPFDLVPENVQPLYAINPLVGVLEAYRWMLFPSAGWPGAIILIPVAASIVLLVTGAAYFQRAERTFADVI